MKLNAALGDFMKTAEAQKFFTSLGMQTNVGTPAQAHEHIVREAARWSQVIKGMGISID